MDFLFRDFEFDDENSNSSSHTLGTMPEIDLDQFLPFSAFSSPNFVRIPRAAPKIKPYSERKDEMVRALHSMPLKLYHTKETISDWTLPEIHKQLKLNGLAWKYDANADKTKLVDALYQHYVGGEASCSESCGICVEDYEDEDVIRSLPCKHVFHVECIDRWAITSTAKSEPPKCPMCNHKLLESYSNDDNNNVNN